MESEVSGPTPPAFSTNLTNKSQCPESDIWDWLYTMQPVYMFTISVLGILGNVFVLLVFCLHKKACSVADIYLGNLAAADLLLMSCLPFWAITVASKFEWQFGSLMCRLVNTGMKLNMYCSVYFLVMVSADRYLALVFALTYGRMRRPWYAKLSCLAVWIWGIILSVPTLTFREVKYISEYSVTGCILSYPSYTMELACDILLVLLGFIIPVIVISYCTCKIIKALHWQVMDRLHSVKKERKATALVLVVLLAFLLCWVPFHLVTILDILMRLNLLSGCPLESGLEICNQIFTYLALSNSMLNPILYVIVGKNFRKKVKELHSSTWKTFA
ncbi:B2 bradykinin receptor-like [Silurus meridionalis]|uniref:B2 bradykinin receptor-like n=1 Tax=Silurus meridionalis TaxID=175797 RepID=UPI001EEC392B|nr:B2 bradykinin receptor-like [Silurus meridionalis]